MNTDSKYITGWLNQYRCVSCDIPVSYRTKMYSHGRCPHCGYKGPNAVTIMDTAEEAVRYKRGGPWWKFWVKPIAEYKD